MVGFHSTTFVFPTGAVLVLAVVIVDIVVALFELSKTSITSQHKTMIESQVSRLSVPY